LSPFPIPQVPIVQFSSVSQTPPEFLSNITY